MKIMVVDDSIVYRTAISQALQDIPGVEIFKTVSNGKIAVDFLKQNPDIDLITLDMEMPVLDGMETIKAIREFNNKVVIIVFSAFTSRGAEKTIDALSSGANDFVQKIEGRGRIEDSIEMIRAELLGKIEGLKDKFDQKSPTGIERVKEAPRPTEKKETLSDIKAESVEKDIRQLVAQMPIKPKLICIGCSTGGPEALSEIFKGIDHKLSIPILVVQHMPPMFTQKLAEMLDKISHVDVKEASVGDELKAGGCLIAPGDFHMVLEKEAKISLNQNEKVCYVRPAVDVLFNSIAENFSGQVLSIVLTGMGDDGANGTRSLDAVGAYQYIQDQESSVVWGMPGAVSKTGIDVVKLPLKQFSELINEVSKRI